MPLADIKTRATRILGTTEAAIVAIDATLLSDQVDLTVAFLLDYFPDVGAYATLSGNDLLFFDWGAAYLVAADLYEPLARFALAESSAAGGTVTKVKQSDVEYTYSDPSKANASFGSGSVAERYAYKGYEYLRRVSAIGYTTPLDTEGVTRVIIPTSTLSPLPFSDVETWQTLRGIS